MHHVQINDGLYEATQRRAAAAGFESVDEYVEQILQDDLQAGDESFDHLFTPERLAQIDRGFAQIDAGQGLSMEEVKDRLAKSRAEWLNKNGG